MTQYFRRGEKIEMSKLLRTKLELIYEGANISKEISDDLLSFTYTDNEGGRADDIDIELKNDHRKWDGAWLPELGDKIKATIKQEGRGAGVDLYCGTFTVDELEFNFPPSTLSIKGVSVPSISDIYRTRKNKAWEEVRLSEIANDVANKGKLAVKYYSEKDPLYDRKDQRNETDLTFLKRLCEDEGFQLKVTDEQLVIFDPREMDESDTVLDIVFGSTDILSASFKMQSHDTYKTCTIEYVNPQTGKKIKYKHTQEDMKEGKDLKITQRVKDLDEAKRVAEAALYKANKGELTGNIQVVGNTKLTAGSAINVIGFGKYDGKYYINIATQNISNGYTTDLEISTTRKPVEDEEQKKKKKGKNNKRDDYGLKRIDFEHG